MKIFNFKINNFYSIFNPMQDKNKNMDSFLDENIRMSLKTNVSQDFTYELMKRVELEKEFNKEDMKTAKIVRYTIGSFIAIMVAFAVVIGFFLKVEQNGKEVSYFNSIIDKFSTFIETISIMATETLGFAFNFETGIVLLLVMVCVFLFSFADKIIFRKG